MLRREDVKKDSVLVCLDNFEHFTKDKEYKVIYEQSIWQEYYRVNDDIDILRCLFDHGFNRLHMFKLKEETSMLKIEDIKEGDVLIALSNDIATFQFTIGKEYKVSKQYDYLTVTPNYGCVMYIKSLHDSCNYSERLKHFKLKQKETTMLDSEIYAVGTVHKSISDFYSYKIIARDITFDDKLYMLTHDINSKNDTMLVSQETGKAITPDISYDLAITKKKIKGWINIKKRDKDTYKWRHAFMYDTKEQAINDRLNPNDYIACIEVEFEEGEGL